MKSNLKIIRSAVGSMASWGLIEELEKYNVEVIGIDSDPLSFGLHALEQSYVVPKGSDHGFINKIIEIIETEKPQAILSGPEEEILALSKNKDIIEDKGTLVLCPDYETVTVCSDKIKINKSFESMNIPTPTVFDKDSAPFPCLIKPRFGRGSVGVHIVKDRKELDFYAKKVSEPVIQEYVGGEEYTIDVLADKKGNALSIVPRVRLFTESGISVKGKTVYDDKLIKFAKKITKNLKVFGPSCMQCIKRGDEYKFLEVNTRFGGGSILSIKADPTIVPNLIRMIEGEKPKPSKGFQIDLIMLRYYSELFVEESCLKDNLNKN